MNKNGERERYYPAEDRSLSDTILGVIEKQCEEDVVDADFRLYNDINPDALNRLFREDAQGETLVKFATGNIIVTLWADGTIDI